MKPGQGTGFWLRWDEVEPRSDPAWSLISVRKREEFRKAAQEKARSIWDARVARGVGTDDEPLHPLSPTTILHRRSAMGRARASAPPLTPARKVSRTRAWLRSRRTEDGVWFYWLLRRMRKQRHPWGDILGFHARGEVRNTPARDVIGFSAEDQLALQRWAAWWWRRNRAQVISQAATTRRTPAGLILRLGTPGRVPPVTFPRPFLPPSIAVPEGFTEYRRTAGGQARPSGARGLERLRRRGGG